MDDVTKIEILLNIKKYENHLKQIGLSELTLKKYIGDIYRFLSYLDSNNITMITPHSIQKYSQYLGSGYSLSTYNSYLISLNKYFRFLNKNHLVSKLDSVPQKQSLENVLSVKEYNMLLDYALSCNDYRDYLLMKTLACTGIRISELEYVTFEAVNKKSATVTSKRKTRTIYFSSKLSYELMCYCIKKCIDEGPIFCTKNKRPLDKSNIWRKLKIIAGKAGVDTKKVYPHSFRHLFAKTYMEKFSSITELADLLGHTSIETTRIYTRSTSEEKRNQLNELGL